jgi:hypothetical protein
MQGILRVAVDELAPRLSVVFQAPIVLPDQSFLQNPLNYSLTGGERIRPRVLKAEIAPPASPPQSNPSVTLTLDTIGDFSVYTLTVSGPNIDPFFSSARLRFRLSCDDRFDCRPPAAPPAPPAELNVAIDYLTKDYASFRQALLDFIPTRLPGWTETSEADIGMMLLELFAATADNLSYMQDRVANEAFLPTAAQRRSVAGHLALIGYQMDEGASARTFLQFQVNDAATLAANPSFKVSNQPASSSDPVIVFETLAGAGLDPLLNSMSLYDWGNKNCCLPPTALTAALAGRFDQLSDGDYVLFDDGAGNRDIVRLTGAPQVVQVPRVTSPPASPPPSTPITIVNWSATTPLHATYCVANTVVCGNLGPAAHGETVSESLRSLTDQQKAELNAEIAARLPGQPVPRQRLKLSQGPLAHFDPDGPQTGDGLTSRPRRSISTLKLLVDGVPWTQQPSLLESTAEDLVYRVELDDDGDATVVFGDGVFGQRPPETSVVTAEYRVGGGAGGNLGAGTLTLPHPASPPPWLISVTNPLPATGGRNLESGDHARRVAPATFQQPLVAVSAADYETAAVALAQTNGVPLIQRANANFRWTGSWLTVTLAADPIGAEVLADAVRSQLTTYLNGKRLAGYDVQVTGPIYVPIDLEITFVATPGAQQADVAQSLLDALSNRTLAGGAKGFFHADNFTFGTSLFVSKLFAAVMGSAAVQSAQITRLARSHAANPDAETAANLAQGFLAVGIDQIIRLDNDRNFPQNGTLTVTAEGTGA